jgi:hypothetical protein
LLALTVLGSCAVSKTAAADEPVRTETYDAGAYPPSSTRFSLFAVGASMSLASYGGAVGSSYLWPDAPGARQLRIPVAGPWLSLGHTGCADTNPGCATLGIVLRAVLTGLDGVVQAGGLALITEALFLPTAAPADVGARSRSRRTHAGLRLRPVPIVTSSEMFGLGVAGQF